MSDRHHDARPSFENLEDRILMSVAPIDDQVAVVASVEAQPAAQEAVAASEVVFIDSAVHGAQALLANIPANAEVITLNAASSGVDQISAVLSGRSNISAIHIISHGTDGALKLGNSTLDASNVATTSAWKAALSQDADILVYGCDVGAGSEGAAFVAALAATTGADVAASDDNTSAADSDLEVTVGAIQTAYLSFSGFVGDLAGGTTIFVNDIDATNPGSGLESDSQNTIGGYAFELQDFPGLTVNDSLEIVSTVGTGNLRVFGTDVNVGTIIPGYLFGDHEQFINEGNFTFLGSNDTSFTYKIHVGGVVTGLETTETATIDIVTAVVAAEDIVTTLTVEHFGLSLDASNGRTRIWLDTTNSRFGDVATQGTLTYRGFAITQGSVTVTQIAAGHLKYTPGATPNYAYTSVEYVLQQSNGNWDWTNTEKLSISVAQTNDAPDSADNAVTIPEDTGYAFNASDFAFSDAIDGASLGGANSLLAVKITSLPAAGTLTLGAANVTVDQMIAVADLGNLVFTPAGNANGTPYTTFTFKVQDDGGTANGGVDLSASYTFTINLTPVADLTATDDVQSMLEDEIMNDDLSGLVATTSGASVVNGQLVFSKASNPTNGSVVVNSNGTFTYTPAANFFGADSFTYTVTDAAASETLTKTVTITVNPVNDAPSFTKGSDIALNEDDAAQTVVGFATAISVGPANEAGQTLSFSVTNDTNSLFAVQPAIAANGTLTFTPAANMFGTAIVSVYAMDNGGTADDGDDTSATQTFTITINPVNDAPSFSVSNVSIFEHSGAYTGVVATGFSPGPANESAQTALGYTVVSNSNPALFTVAPSIAADGTLTFTPSDVLGVATITVTVQDSGGTANGGVDTSTTRTFTITVNGINDEPDFTLAGNVVVNEDSGAYSASGISSFVAGPADEAGQTATYTVTNNNNSLFAVQPSIAADGSLSFTPTANASGTAIVSVYVMDNGGTLNGGDDTSSIKTFTITVNPVNDVPSFTVGANQSVAEDAGAQTVNGFATALSKGPADEASQTLDFIVTNNNNPLFSVQPSIDANGNLTYTAAPDANGVATVSVRIHDDGGTANGGVDTSAIQTFTITITAVTDIAADTISTSEDVAVDSNLLTNDNFEGDEVITAVTQGTNGTVTIVDGAAGTVRYTPNADWNGTDSYTYTVTSGGVTETATVNVTVTPVVDIATDTATTTEETAVTTNVLANDTFEATPVVTAVTQGTNGTVTILDANLGTVRYTPNADFNGTDSYSYTVTSGGVTETAIVNVTVTAVVDITDDSASTNEDTAVTTNVLTNDNFEGTESITAVTQGTHGTVTILDANLGTVSYTPNADFNGTDSYTYTVTSGGVTETAIVNVTVAAVVDIAADTISTNEDTAVTSNLLTNDNFEGAEVITAVTQGTNGTVTIIDGNLGTVRYTPNADFNGTDSYTYTVTSPTGITETATVTVTVNAVADIVADSATTAEDTAVTTNVLANDNFEGTPVITAVTQGSNGSVAIVSGQVVYTPNADFNGTDSYTYTVTSGGVTETATVNVTVTAVVDIANDTASTAEDTAVTTDVLANDNFEGTPVITSVTQGANGAVAIVSGQVRYTPNADFNGTDSYTYTVTSGGVTETATVNVTITAVADIANDTATTAEDTAVTTDVLANDSFEGTPVITSVTQGTNGVVAIVSGQVRYTPNADFNGTDSYTYTVTSGGLTETATVNVTVTAVADIVADSISVNEDGSVTSNLLTNDTFEATPTITAVTQGANGTVAIVNGALGTVSYTPSGNFNGTDSYTYTVTSAGLTETVTVTVTINSVNDAPAGTDKTIVIDQDASYTFSASDFALSDVNDSPANTLAGVTITTLPVVGTLTLSAAPVIIGQVVAVANLGNLVYTPVASATGNPYTTFTFQVQDNGGTSNSGVDLDQSANTLTVIVLPALTITGPNTIATDGENPDVVAEINDQAYVVTVAGDNSGNALSFSVSTNGGGTWTAVTALESLTSNGPGASTYTLDLNALAATPALDSSNFKVRVTETFVGGGARSKDLAVKVDNAANAPAINTLTAANTLNAWNYSFGGTAAEAGAVVSFSLGDGVHTALTGTATANGSGVWTVSGINILSLNDGTLTLTVFQTDIYGNVSPTATATVTKNTDTVMFAGPLGNVTASNATAYRVSGYAKVGASVVINVGGVPNTVTADAETGAFSAVVNMSAIANSPSFSLSAQQTKSGTTYAPTTTTIVKNSAVITAPTVATTTGGAASAFPLSGTGTAGSTITVVITSGSDTVVLGGIVVDGSGNWSTTVNLSTVASGGITVRLYQRLSNGNQSATVTSATSTIAAVTDDVHLDIEEMLDGKSLELWVKAGKMAVEDLSWTDFMDRPSLSESLTLEVDAFQA